MGTRSASGHSLPTAGRMLLEATLGFTGSPRCDANSASLLLGFARCGPIGIGTFFRRKKGRHGLLTCISPLGGTSSIQPVASVWKCPTSVCELRLPTSTGEAETLFSPSEFTVTAPPNSPYKIGDPLKYGDTLVLVDQLGSIWNNKTGASARAFSAASHADPGLRFHFPVRRQAASPDTLARVARRAFKAHTARCGSLSARPRFRLLLPRPSASQAVGFGARRRPSVGGFCSMVPRLAKKCVTANPKLTSTSSRRIGQHIADRPPPHPLPHGNR